MTDTEISGPWIIYDFSNPIFHRTLPYLEILSARARRCAARAKFGLVDYFDKPWDPRVGETVVEAFHELEPWSKSWLEWWEEDTKIDLDEVEGGSNVA